MQLAPLDVAVQKLNAQSPDVRAVALVHLAGHREAARPYAAKVASMLTDVESVAWHAMGTLGAIAQGAEEAVPVLVELLERPDANERLMRRALGGLRSIGGRAKSALAVIEKLAQGPYRDAAVETLAAIAPEEPAIEERLLSAAFSADYGLARVGAEALKTSPGLAKRALGELQRRVQSDDEAVRRGGLKLLWTLSTLAPAETTGVMRALVHTPGAARDVVWAMQNLRPPVHEELVGFGLRCLEHPAPDVQEAALKTLEKLDISSEPRPLVDRHADAPWCGGPKGQAARVFAAAALALTRAGKLDGPQLQRVLAWVGQLKKAQPGKNMEVSWYTIRDVVSAAVLATRNFQYAIDAAKEAQRFIDSDESGVLDFHRTLRKLATDDVRMAALQKAGVPRVDPYDDPEEPVGKDTPPDYPEFPEDKPPQPPGRLDDAKTLNIKSDLKRGRALVGVKEGTTPLEHAEALQAWFARRQREQTPAPSADDEIALASVWVHCLLEGCGWLWASYRQGDAKPQLVVASPDRRAIVMPGAWVANQLGKRDPTALLQFNMIVDGKSLPQGSEPVALW